MSSDSHVPTPAPSAATVPEGTPHSANAPHVPQPRWKPAAWLRVVLPLGWLLVFLYFSIVGWQLVSLLRSGAPFSVDTLRAALALPRPLTITPTPPWLDVTLVGAVLVLLLACIGVTRATLRAQRATRPPEPPTPSIRSTTPTAAPSDALSPTAPPHPAPDRASVPPTAPAAPTTLAAAQASSPLDAASAAVPAGASLGRETAESHMSDALPIEASLAAALSPAEGAPFTGTPFTGAPSSTPPTSPRIFISHSSGDNAFGIAITDRLRTEGIDVWYDAHGEPDAHGEWQGSIPPATYWQDEIVRELTSRGVFLILLSERSVASQWVHEEIGLAWSEKNSADVTRGKVIVPVLRQTCAVPPLVSLVQYVDYRPEADQARAFRDLLYAVRLSRTRPAPAVELGPPFDLGLLPPLERFIGREQAVERVIDLVTGGRAGAGQVASIAAANGLAGIGKTALATEVVRRLMGRNAFPDGIAVVLCKEQTDPVRLLRGVLARFTIGRREPDDDDLPALSDRAQLVLQDKRALVVLDNVEQGWPVGAVLGPLRAAGAAVLVTARAELPAVPREASLMLEVLPLAEVLDVFALYYGRGAALDLTRPEQEAATRIVTALGRHTLAVKLAAANAATLHRSLETVAQELAANPRRGLLLENGEEAVRYVLDSSYAALAAEEAGSLSSAQRLFVTLAAFATADVGRKALLAVVEAVGDEDAERSLRQVVALRLVDAALSEAMPPESDRERVRLHPLVQTYARDHFGHWDEGAREAAQASVTVWYADYANATPDLALTPDEANITGALEWTFAYAGSDTDADRVIARICRGMAGFWRDTGRTRAGLTYLPGGAEAAERVAATTGERDDQLLAATIASYYGDFLRTVGKLSEAEGVYMRDLELRRQLADRRGEGVTLNDLGQVAQARGRLDEAAAYYQQALEIDREVQDRQGEGVVLYSLALIAETAGDLDRAEAFHRESLALGVEVQNGPDIADSLLALGRFLVEHERNPEEGCQMLHEAIRRYHEMGLPGEAAARETAQVLGCLEERE